MVFFSSRRFLCYPMPALAASGVRGCCGRAGAFVAGPVFPFAAMIELSDIEEAVLLAELDQLIANDCYFLSPPGFRLCGRSVTS
jgi:hypothetical protein